MSNDIYKIIGVTFSDGCKVYAYYCDFPVEVGDTIIVYARRELNLVTVARTDRPTKEMRMKVASLAVCKVDLTDYKKRDELLTAYLEAKEKLFQLKEEYEEMEFYEAIAKHNPEMQKALDHYNALRSGTPLAIEKS